MDGICLKPGFIGITATPITAAGDIRKNPSQITTAVSRTTTASAISSENPSVSGSPSPWGFSLKLPLISQLVGNRNRHDALAVDDAVLVDRNDEAKEEIESNGKNENWLIEKTASAISSEKPSPSPWGFSPKVPLTSLLVGNRNRHDALAVDDAVLVDRKDEAKEEIESNEENENWVSKILHVKLMWTETKDSKIKEEDQQVENDHELDHQEDVSLDEDECDACRVDNDNDDKIEFDRNSFSKLLRRVSLVESRLHSQMFYLGSLAYSIPQIKAGNLLKHYKHCFVTSSIEKKAQLAAIAKAENEIVSLDEVKEDEKLKETTQTVKIEGEKKGGNLISASTAYHIAASAASYLHSQTMNIIPFHSSENNRGEDSISMTTDSVTAVVAAKEEVKQAVADDLNSMHSSPCDWYICDDDESSIRYFVIQGSESLASWQANLLFEPIQFEGLDVIVHRGIYEAAKGIYEQMLPEVHAHLQSHGDRAKFRFTGHSLGGSLSLLVNLMLLIRGQVPRSSLLSVITFGAPYVMCGGDRLLHKLGLPKSHLQAITMHRDIVPRAFSCKYPSRVAELLKALNGNFRNHPCLDNQNLLYAPMGEFLILQPDAKLSPSHDLLPSGSGLYVLSSSLSDAMEAEKQTRAAQSVFLNTPHPLEILSDRSAYGSGGAIQRDHDMESYLVSIQSVIRQELNRVRKTRREHRRRAWWPLVVPRDENERSQFTGVLQTGSESFKRFTRLVASEHMNLLLILLFPARFLVVEACKVMRLG